MSVPSAPSKRAAPDDRRPAATPRRRLSGAARRGAILRGALGVFAARGYDGASMAELGTAAGVTRTVLYDHFRSKQELYVALVEQQNALFLGHVGARITGEGSTSERMRATIDAVFHFAQAHPAAWALLFGAMTGGDDAVADTRRALRAGQVEAVAALLARDAHEAGLDRDPAQMAVIVEMLIGALTGAVAWWGREPSVSRDAVVDAAMELLWTGLGRPAAERERP
jgi:AcrR family transcriptional regulator